MTMAEVLKHTPSSPRFLVVCYQYNRWSKSIQLPLATSVNVTSPLNFCFRVQYCSVKLFSVEFDSSSLEYIEIQYHTELSRWASLAHRMGCFQFKNHDEFK